MSCQRGIAYLPILVYSTQLLTNIMTFSIPEPAKRQGSKSVPGKQDEPSIKFQDLLVHFKNVQARHEKFRRQGMLLADDDLLYNWRSPLSHSSFQYSKMLLEEQLHATGEERIACRKHRLVHLSQRHILARLKVALA